MSKANRISSQEANPPKKNGTKKGNRSAKKKLSPVKILVLLAVLAVLGITGFLAYVFYGPRWGPIHYGICKVFVERYIDFPTTLKVRDVEYYGPNIRIFVSHQDSAGQFNYNVFECEYARGTFEITRARKDRKIISDLDTKDKVHPEILESFNKGIPAILRNPPDLLLPRSTRGLSLNELWIGDN
ncbi:MAG: hypothetical protein H6855_06125 [Rhodospirillales bacterium]|nr:hypothetical protein [Rhodospirillales bacterium]MCB9965640.1 hypothetical protein [Rhodospirillales bacterium]MCB9973064.1 hypothetical protein [Rhodospirillales bacterium]